MVMAESLLGSTCGDSKHALAGDNPQGGTVSGLSGSRNSKQVQSTLFRVILSREMSPDSKSYHPSGTGLTTRLVLARHGRVEERYRGKIYGDLDVALSPAGEEQSRRIASLFRGQTLEAVVSSGLSRADHTARLLAGAAGLEDRQILCEPRLRELHRGEWAGLGESEVEQREPGGWQRWLDSEGMLVPPGGETHGELAARVLPALDELAALHRGGVVAIVAHKWVLRVALAAALGLELERLPRLEVPTSGLLVLEYSVGELAPPPGQGQRAGGPSCASVRVVGLGLAGLPG